MPMLKDVVTSCVSTTVANRLSLEVIAEAGSLDKLVDFSDLDIEIDVKQFPFLQPQAKASLARAIRSRGQRMRITSAYRTCVQQYLLRARFEQRVCGITAAARPGKSRHESGLALDIPDVNGWRPYLEAEGWSWLGQVIPADPFHFSFPGTPIGNEGVRAFQVLWNRNHLNDTIDVDGVYGDQTATRLRISPSEGFSGGNGSTLRISTSV